MAELAQGLRRPSALRAPDQRDLATVGLVVMAAAMGFAAGRAGTPVLALALFAGACVVGLAGHWRALLVGMLVYLPFSGLPSLILYPNTAPGALAKDFLFVVPAYVGAAAAAVSGRERFDLPGAPVLLFGALGALILVQAFNPEIPKTLVALIGIKVWAFYIPLLWLGYHFVRDKAQVQRLLYTMAVIALVPCLIGIAEAFVVQVAGRGYVYALYGPAAEAATQGFARFGFQGDAALTRIPSIFEFVSQYWLFCTATIAIGYAAWRGNRTNRTLRWLGPLVIAVAVLASMTSGLRAAFIFSPFLLLLIAMLEGANFGRMLAYLGGSVLAIVAALTILRVPAGPLAELTGGQGLFILGLFQDGFQYGLDNALLGLGTGVDTNGISYAFGSDDYAIIYATVGDVWRESWYLKAFLELGVVGLLLLIALVVALVRRALVAHSAVSDPELRSMSAAFVALFLWNIVYSVKTAYIDLDPMAVYVWFFLGVQWRLVALEHSRAGASAPRT